MRVIAIDWSGAKAGAERKIWLAEVAAGKLVRLENGRDRAQMTGHLISLAEKDPDLVVGFDFAFSLPGWFLAERGFASAPEFWAAAAEHAETWLQAWVPPFWGGGRGGRPELRGDHYRRSDLALPKIKGISAKSVFQVGGSGSVGTGSLRGWPILHALRSAGFAVWPFDPVALPLIVEIYPRVLTGGVNKSSREARIAYLNHRFPRLAPDHLDVAASSEDAFDATVSALVMAAEADDIVALPALTDAEFLLEGVIWHPGLKLASGGPD